MAKGEWMAGVQARRDLARGGGGGAAGRHALASRLAVLGRLVPMPKLVLNNLNVVKTAVQELSSVATEAVVDAAPAQKVHFVLPKSNCMILSESLCPAEIDRTAAENCCCVSP
eukprot:6212935-Pleurochrysis_carterae.AAC.4